MGSGNVTSVGILSGPPVLARSTEENIRNWKFRLAAQTDKAERKHKTRFSYHLSNRYVPENRVPPITFTLDSFEKVEITSSG